MSFVKTVEEKLETKLKTLSQYGVITRNRNEFLVREESLLQISDTELIYGTRRFSPNSINPIWEDNYSVTLILNHENLPLVNSNPINPPKGAKTIYDIFESIPQINIHRIHIGCSVNSLQGGDLHITKELYKTILKIDREERKDKKIRVFNRMLPFLESEFDIDTSENEIERDYSLLLTEVLASG